MIIGQGRRRDVVGPAPHHELLVAELLPCLRLVLTLQRAVVALVQPPRPGHRQPEQASLLQRQIGRLDGAGQHRRVHDLRGEPVVAEQLAAGDRLPGTGAGEPDVHPAGEQALRVPLAFAVPEQHQCGHGRELIRRASAGNTRCGCVVAVGGTRDAAARPPLAGTRDAASWSPVGRWMPVARRVPRRIATISVHTSPLEQPGTGDAGGLNVYVVEVAKRMAARGVEVEIFTRAVSRDAPPVDELVTGVLVRHVPAGPFEELDKADLPAQLCQFTLEVLRTEAAYAPGRYDLVHGHYWLSGHVGAVAKERWGVPLVQSMHTLGRVKNAALAHGDMREPEVRLRGEADVVAAADRLVANTDEEARQLAGLYEADPAKIWTVNPGVDLSIFRPGPAKAARQRLGLPEDGYVIVFAGRIQPLKAPDVVLHATAALVRDCPALAETL